MDNRLQQWADQLLDTGKRNNLINFKDSKNGTVEIVSPDSFTFFSRIFHTSSFEIFTPQQELEPASSWIYPEDFGEKSDKNAYLSQYGAKLKKNLLLAYNIDKRPAHALKNIMKRAQTALEETGVNIAHMAFGFIHWKEDENSHLEFQAPILLVPIRIENESSVDPFVIRPIDDEVLINPTFAFKLQADHGLHFPEFDEDEGLSSYLEKVSVLVSKLGWTVSPECKIGIFSFQKINMYRDLIDNADQIERNDNIRTLLGYSGSGPDSILKSTDFLSHQSFDLLSLHNVIDADSSQAEAIEMAKTGKSFVLQGPPGTGKSQTIANMIAECLFDGKKILFVSEKLAALNVVYEKLKNVGLEEFCLELHSQKANKKQVIEDLCRTLRLPKSGVSDKAERELRLKKEAQDRLEAYTEELHKIRPVINTSLYKLFERASSFRKYPDIEFVISNIQHKGEDFLEAAERDFSRYEKYTDSIGYDYRKNIWYGYRNPDSSYQAIIQLKSDLSQVATWSENLESFSGEVQRFYGFSVDSVNLATAAFSFFELMKDSAFLTPRLFSLAASERTLDIVQQMQTCASNIRVKKAALDLIFDKDVYDLDASVLYKRLTKQYGNWFSRLFGRGYRLLLSQLKMCRKDGEKPSYNDAVSDVSLLRDYQEELLSFCQLEKSIRVFLGAAWQGVDTDFQQLLSQLEKLISLQKRGLPLGTFSNMDDYSFEEEKHRLSNVVAAESALFVSDYSSFDRLTLQFDCSICNLRDLSLPLLREKCIICSENTEKLVLWYEFSKLLDSLSSLQLLPLLDFLLERNTPTHEIAGTFLKAFYTQWIDSIIHDDPVLMDFSRLPHDEAVKQFKEKDRLTFEINKTKIKTKLSAMRPGLDMVARGSSISVLLREGEKKRKQKGIRKLFFEIGDLVQLIKPCFLMSPLSVSTFLPPSLHFDVIVFDEASQIFPQDAAGAIYRGNQLIVVGDSKQMPPSNFFNSAADLDLEDDDDESITDFESILDLCSASFPQCRLKWHYRSRFEQLIAFSNQNFYENDLVTFPAATFDKSNGGIKFIPVNGIFDRKSKSNSAEAERIVDLVFDCIEKNPERSLGVVAFSISQQSLIDRLISRRRQEDPSKEFFFRSDRPEPFFVKNLETVQGDERDTIAYAKDSSGKMLLNFGPLNREGGERRLNVAVTRAKFSVLLVSSLHACDIDLSRTKSRGVTLLHDYLDYAEHGDIALKRNLSLKGAEQFDSDFEQEVYDFLLENGFSVDTQVGCSSFRIDLALKKPDSSNYVLAIECDGASYHSGKTARDRDRLRQEILERLGWHFYRIWSTDWFRNKRTEQNRLLTAAKDALENSPIYQKEVLSAQSSFEEPLPEHRFTFPTYTFADIPSLRQNFVSFPEFIHAILVVEAPLSEEWLLKRIVHLFNREKVTKVVWEEYEFKMRNCFEFGIIRKNGFLYLRNMNPPKLRIPAEGMEPREIKYVDLNELASGMRELLKQNVSAEKLGLYKLLTQQLGFSRMGDAILNRMEQALFLIHDEIEENDGILSLKEVRT